MTFTQSIQSAFNRAGDFKGRSARSEYWWFLVAYMLLAFLAVIVDLATKSDFGVMAGGPPMGYGLATLILGLVMLLPATAVQFRRLHDTGRSAWWCLIGAVPIVGALVLLYFLAQRGEAGSNRFGDDPLDGRVPAATFTPPTAAGAHYQVGGAGPGLQQPGPEAAMAPVGASVIEALERLAKLRDTGVLTQQEFEAQKAQLLRR